jgi:glycosyltransferase involved in cell wall biosynthesis
MRISYAITAHNEHKELSNLLEHLFIHKRDEDEIVVQLDETCTEEVKMVVSTHKYKINKVVTCALNNDFATFKNNLKGMCSGDYIFQIDADEIPNVDLLRSLPDILLSNPTVDLILVPRINTVEGLTEQHIKQWGWNVNHHDRVNFPDYQWRIWKNIPKIKWINKVHERLDGFKKYAPLPAEDEFCLLHPKTIERQEKQNEFYNTL